MFSTRFITTCLFISFSAFIVLFASCNSTIERQPTYLTGNDIREISGNRLQQHVESSDRHVLVEFALDADCGFSSSMNHCVHHLANKYVREADVVRINYRDNVELVNRFGGTACPTYVLFERGELDPVYVQSFPTNSDTLEADLLALLALSTDD
ncbi:MAG: thioredoxin domain-containing protein [Planctomycetota bacterium]